MKETSRKRILRAHRSDVFPLPMEFFLHLFRAAIPDSAVFFW